MQVKLKQGFAVRRAGPRMDELKSWMHFDSAAAVHLDPVLGMADRTGLVSFVFANERDAERVAGAGVQEEKQFTRDANAIHVAAEAHEDDAVVVSESDESDGSDKDEDEDED